MMTSYYENRKKWQREMYNKIKNKGFYSYNALLLDASLNYGYGKTALDRFIKMLLDTGLISLEGDEITFKGVLKNDQTSKNKKFDG